MLHRSYCHAPTACTGARASLHKCAAIYPLCPKPHVALGSMLLSMGRPRAALRRFERALALAPDARDDDAYLALVNAGTSAVRLVAAHPQLAPALLPSAERRLRSALDDASAERDRTAIERLLREAEAMAAVV